MPEISIEVAWRPWRECSRIKSSIKVTLLAQGRSGLISEEWTLSACPTGLDESRLLLDLADRQLFASHFLGRLIAAPVALIPYLNGDRLGQSLGCRRRESRKLPTLRAYTYYSSRADDLSLIEVQQSPKDRLSSVTYRTAWQLIELVSRLHCQFKVPSAFPVRFP